MLVHGFVQEVGDVLGRKEEAESERFGAREALHPLRIISERVRYFGDMTLNPTPSTAMLRLTALLALLVSLLTTSARIHPPENQLEALLERARKASGFTELPNVASLELVGGAENMGAPGQFAGVYSRRGQFKTALIGDLPRYVSFDGKQAWERELNTGPYPLEFFAREWAVLRAWVHSGYWLAPDAPVTVMRSPRAAEGFALEVRLANGLLTALVHLDKESLLPTRMSLPNGNGELFVEFDQYERVATVQLAHLVRTQVFEGSSSFWELTQVTRKDDLPVDTFCAPPRAKDTHFKVMEDNSVELLRNERKHLFLRPIINGKEVGLFLFDTGAGFSGVRREVVEELGLAVIGENSVTGLGGALSPTKLSRIDSLQLGPLTIRDLVVTQSQIGKTSEVNGERVVGVLGWDLLSRAVIDFDPGGGRMRIFDPASPSLAAMTGVKDSVWQPIHLHYSVPYVEMEFDGDRHGLFMVDTGAAGFTVYFYADVARRLGLLSKSDGEPRTQGTGAGGAFSSTLGHLDWVHFARAGKLNDLSIVLGVGEDGEVDPYSLGLLGGGVLRLYRLVIDYSRNRIAFLPK